MTMTMTKNMNMNSNPKLKRLVLAAILMSGYLPAFAEVAAIPDREWKSTTGTSLKASAERLDGQTVVFKKADGKELKVALDKSR